MVFEASVAVHCAVRTVVSLTPPSLRMLSSVISRTGPKLRNGTLRISSVRTDGERLIYRP